MLATLAAANQLAAQTNHLCRRRLVSLSLSHISCLMGDSLRIAQPAALNSSAAFARDKMFRTWPLYCHLLAPTCPST